LVFSGNCHHKRYYQGAIVESVAKFLKDNAISTGPTGARLDDKQQLQFFRGQLRRMITYNTSKIFKSTVSQIIDPVGCKDVRAMVPTLDKDDQFVHDLREKECGKPNACGLKQYVSDNKGSFAALRSTLLRIKTPDEETIRRIAALRELYRIPNATFDKLSCFRSGDAIIVHECPKECVLVTKNKKHIAPIAESFNKVTEYYA
jgi:hypothetical protein